MKTSAALVLALAGSAAAFSPTETSSRPSTARDALADRIFGLDLWEPVKDSNTYGARAKKNIKVGKLGDNSYVPSGLTKAQYEKIRADAQAKKEKNYKDRQDKAFQFTDFPEWYAKRGTELGQGWKKDVNLGHTMAKTKFDWSGNKDLAGVGKLGRDSSSGVESFASQFSFKAKPATKKAAKTTPKKKAFWQ